MEGEEPSLVPQGEELRVETQKTDESRDALATEDQLQLQL